MHQGLFIVWLIAPPAEPRTRITRLLILTAYARWKGIAEFAWKVRAS